MDHAEKNGIILRSNKAAAKINPPTGNRNWMTGRNKNNCAFCKEKSDLMKINNPANNNKTRIKMSSSLSEYFKKNPLKQEIKFSEILDRLKVKYVFQHPINRYVIDFFIPKINLCIEIDSTSKMGKVKRQKAAIKDMLLNSLGFNVLRINKTKLDDELFIDNVLKANNVI
jgi:very-short-patch-repair endonuclease